MELLCDTPCQRTQIMSPLGTCGTITVVEPLILHNIGCSNNVFQNTRRGYVFPTEGLLVDQAMKKTRALRICQFQGPSLFALRVSFFLTPGRGFDFHVPAAAFWWGLNARTLVHSELGACQETPDGQNQFGCTPLYGVSHSCHGFCK